MDIDPADAPPAPIALQYLAPRNEPSRRGKGSIAVCGTILCPGLGHLIVSRPRRALGWVGVLLAALSLVVITLRFVVLAPVLVLLVPAWVVLYVACLLDAYLCGRQLAGNLLNGPVVRYFAGFFLIGCTILAHP